MSFVFPTNASQVQAFAGALYGVQVGTTTMAQVNADIAANGGLASTLNSYYAATFGGVATSTVASTVATNLGLTGDALASGTAYITAQLNGAAAGARGAVISSIVNLFGTLSADATFGAAATAWNAKVATAAAYTGASNVAIGTQVTTSAVFTLTTGTDVADDISASRGNLSSTFKFSSGNETVNASVGTLNDGDILIDASTTDADVLNISGSSGTATVSNVETINLTAAAASTLQMDNITGVKNVNVTGTNTVTVDGFAAATLQPTFGVNNITRVVTLQPATLAGNTTDANAETLNLSVSGLSYGTTTATRSSIAIDGKSGAGVDADGVLETLNITSAGTTANDFELTFDSGDSVARVAVSGDQSVQIRVANDAISSVTVDGTANTGTMTLRVDREGKTTTALNAANFTGVDNLLLVDSAAGSDAGVVASLQSGAMVTFGSNFSGANSSLSLQGATFSALKDSINVTLDNVAAAAAGVSLVQLNVQNTKALNLNSAGHSASTSTSGANLIDDLIGDFTTITISGDTSLEVDLNIDDVQTATSTTTARTVAVNASGMTGTAFVNLGEIAPNSKVGYNITGTANGDNVVLNNTAGTVTGGAGNDSITGGNANDVIDSGDGVDLITISYGSDTITGGAGNDVIDINATGATATAQVSTLTNTADGNGGSADDSLTVTINGVAYSYTTSSAGTTTATQYATAFIAQHGNAILGASGVTVTQALDSNSAATAGLIFTGAADGTAFTISARDFTAAAGAGTAIAVSTGTPAVAAQDVNSTIMDFAVGDVVNVATLSLGSGGYYEGAAGSAVATTAYGVIVLTSASYASADLAEDAVASRMDINGSDGGTSDVLIVFLNSTTGKAQAFWDGDIDTGDTIADSAVVMTFDNITTLTGIASTFSADSFVF